MEASAHERCGCFNSERIAGDPSRAEVLRNPWKLPVASSKVLTPALAVWNEDACGEQWATLRCEHVGLLKGTIHGKCCVLKFNKCLVSSSRQSPKPKHEARRCHAHDELLCRATNESTTHDGAVVENLWSGAQPDAAGGEDVVTRNRLPVETNFRTKNIGARSGRQ